MQQRNTIQYIKFTTTQAAIQYDKLKYMKFTITNAAMQADSYNSHALRPLWPSEYIPIKKLATGAKVL